MTNDVEYLFIYLCHSLVKCLFKSFAHFLIGNFLIKFEEYLYILYTDPSLDVWFADMFSQFVAWVFILLSVFVDQKFLILIKSNLQAYLGDIVCSVPDHWNKVSIIVKRVTRIFLFPSAYERYVYTILKPIKCAIALCLKKQCTYLNLKILNWWKILTTIW